MSLDQKIALLGVIAQFAISIAGAAIAVITYFSSRRAYEAQSKMALLTTINSFNALALTNDDCLKVFHKLLSGCDTDDISDVRLTWAAYSFLNNRQIHYFISKSNHTKKGYLEEDRKNLSALMAQPRVKEVLESGGYDPEFIKYCKETACVTSTPPSAS